MTKQQVTLEYVTKGDSLEAIKSLFREYVQSLQLDLSFQDFETELQALPGKYAPPEGVLILARVDGKPAGCIALRKLEEDVCEMKRLFVTEQSRGLQLGRQLITQLLEEAKSRGYRVMRLDTLASLQAAVHLYRSFGFYEIDAYIYNPSEEAIYMEIQL